MVFVLAIVSLVVNPEIVARLHRGVYGTTINENHDNESDHEVSEKVARLLVTC